MKLEFFFVQCDNIIANSDAVSFQFHRNTVGSLGPFLQLRGRKTTSDSSISLSVLHFTENCFLFMLFFLQTKLRAVSKNPKNSLLKFLWDLRLATRTWGIC